MAEELIIDTDLSREEIYAQILPQISALLEGETDLIANMANVTAVLKQALGFFWIGFYRRV
ncbi:MAG: GAF domain-containing protein, partial [Bacteroidia bacterium]|nr:GAF domain-containing protein [Bacteroidia bacterium]